MKSQCFVSADDFQIHWHQPRISVTASQAPLWNGVERRALADRRSPTHERRWEKARGRRFRLADRRRS